MSERGETDRDARAAERREQILRAASGLYAERGYRGTSFALVAERVGLTQQGVLHYFPNKVRLLQAVLARRDQLDEAAFTPRRGEPERLFDSMVRVAEINAERRGLVQAFTVLAADSVTDGHPAQEYFRDRYA